MSRQGLDHFLPCTSQVQVGDWAGLESCLRSGGIISVVLQTPAGAVVDRVRSKRLILLIGSAVLACGAVLLSWTAAPWAVYTSQLLIGGAGPFLAPTLAAVTIGLVGRELFDR